jgi:hypothetical protein
MAMPSVVSVWAMTLAGALVSAGALAESRPVVLELYTSEGCSSCPPAEALVAALAQHRPDVLPLSFHVDYWDNQGWHDRFSLAEATRRQHRYADKSRHDSVYTPQGIIDGSSDRALSGPSLLSELATPREGVAIHGSFDDGFLNLSLAGKPGASSSDVLLIAFLRQATTHVGRGENSGKTLEEFNIVRSIQRLGSWNGSAGSFRVPLSSLPKDATHAAILIQTKGQGPILGAMSLPVS